MFVRSCCPPIRRARLTAIIEAAALLFHLVRCGVAAQRLVWVGIEVFRDWFAGSPVPGRFMLLPSWFVG